MKKILKIFIILMFELSIFAKSIILSPLPIPNCEVLDIELQECDDNCLFDYLENGKVFSFLSKAKNSENEKIKENYMLLSSTLNISPQFLAVKKMNIAMILPTKKIGSYAISTTRSIISYLLFRNVKFHLKTFEIKDENYETILETIENIKKENFNFIIAPLTLEGANNLANINTENLNIFIPTINKNDVFPLENSNIIFGGINYKEQIDKLLDYANENIIIFYENRSPLAYKLTKIIENESNSSKIKEIEVQDEAANLKKFFYKNEDINSSTIFLNTPIVKSSLILSQLTLYDLKPIQILSTQINYNPLLFNLTQPIDRENLIIANSIIHPSKILEEYNSLINNDIEFNWINYSTSIGIDIFFNKETMQKRVFDENIENNQINYNVMLYKALYGKFILAPIIFQTDLENPEE
ncbi:hypothetical protein [Nitrosophilus kaiyonis]|uniref:hypothetical protein n=1 Tax=Nitrosophilus kaiyonis TaxID=2930200 RepID=UPI002492593F|nr:hypothetical protein [Nitrosophilus kaiyonis]